MIDQSWMTSGGEAWVDHVVTSVKERAERGDPDLNPPIFVSSLVEMGE